MQRRACSSKRFASSLQLTLEIVDYFDLLCEKLIFCYGDPSLTPTLSSISDCPSFFSLSHRVASLQSMFFGYLRENLSASDSLDAAFIHSRVYNRLSRLPGWDETQRAYYMELLSVPPFPRFSHPAEERIDLRRNIISPQDPQRAIESAETRDFEPAARDRLRSRILESITCSSARCSLRTARPSSKRSASISTCKTAMILIGSRVCST